MRVSEGNLTFDFLDAVHAFKFDESKDKTLVNFHGLSHCMKAVDIVAEYEDRYLFVEVKNPGENLGRYDSDSDRSKLIQDLVYKYRDTLIYRWAERKIDKPVYYLCLIELDNGRVKYLYNLFERQLPCFSNKVLPVRWHRPIVEACAVLNRESWNRNFPRIPVTLSQGGQC